jgi:predicted metalloprotease with PDZ domain
MEYTIRTDKAYKHFITIELTINVKNPGKIKLQLPAWRPGRYELANYAKNVRNFSAYDQDGNELVYAKTTKDLWDIETQNAQNIKVLYTYFAKQMDAGGSFVDEEICYLNFINCLLYQEESINDPCKLRLEINSAYKIACGLEVLNNSIHASSYYELADSPLIAAEKLMLHSYESHNTIFNIWVHGKVSENQDNLIKDFKKFTQKQCELFGEFPESSYHFLIHILPYPHYHGVEHAKSTVITLGPDSSFNEKEFYSNLLGISSHELFHAWNVCKIRPLALMPYNFKQENYFDTGYVAEGFTTYYGDLMLARAGVYSVDEYFAELNVLLKRHYENFGRKNKSLAESSIDLWLDGYVAGVPNRKVSIYVKGAVIALLIDLWIRESTTQEKSLDDVLRQMWQNFGKTQKGYMSSDIKALLDLVSEKDSEDIFTKYIYGTEDEEHELSILLNTIGCEVLKTPNILDHERTFGFRVNEEIGNPIVLLIVPASPASKVLVEGDQITHVNNQTIEGKSLIELIKGKAEVELKVFRAHKTHTLVLKKDEITWLPNYTVRKKENASEAEKTNFSKWIHQEF